MAGTVIVSWGRRTEQTAELVFSCTGDASDGSIPDTSSGAYSSIFKKFPFPIRCIIENTTAQTDVADNSDVYIYEGEPDNKGADILNGQGVDQLDADTRNYIRLNYSDPLMGPVTLDVDNQSEVSAEYTVTLILSK